MPRDARSAGAVRRAGAARREATAGWPPARSDARGSVELMPPHFLFNCLSAVSAIVRAGRTDDALGAIDRLGSLHRAVVERARTGLVPLARELALAADYLALERLRFGPRLAVRWSLSTGLSRRPVPSLVLLPLIENAVTHGAARCRGPAAIHVVAARFAGHFRLTISNEMPAAAEAGISGTGFGQRAVRAQLAAHYGSLATLHAGPDGRGTYVATLLLPWSPPLGR